MSQACGFDPNVAFAVMETPREWVSVCSVLLRKVHGIPSPLDLLHQWCHLSLQTWPYIRFFFFFNYLFIGYAMQHVGS